MEEIPKVVRPKDDLSRPETIEEQAYCWFYWLDQIANPKTTRFVLDNLDFLPMFQAPWGPEWEKGEKMELERQRRIMGE